MVRSASQYRRSPAALIFPQEYIVSRTPAMLRLYEELALLAATDLPVLLAGETGVGKELIARTLHLNSPSREGPFVAVNCGALPRELAEAELFGIGDGVATGVKKRPGLLRTAHGGTLLLDELGEMPPDLQVKLLRTLQEAEVRPLGGRPRKVDLRIVGATNTDLRQRVNEGVFRRDLYYRVAGASLTVPPLRRRRADIPLLAERFVERTARRAGLEPCRLSSEGLRALTAYPWPGNVRELDHEMQRLVHLYPGDVELGPEALPERILEPAPAETGPPPGAEASTLRLADHVRRVERHVILRALERARGSQRQAARLLEISRNTLARKIKELGVSL